MGGVHLAAGRQADALTHLFHLALQPGAQAHLRVAQRGVHLLERFGHGDLGVGLLGRIDPQVEHRTRTGQLAARLFVLGQALLEQREGLVQRLPDLIDVGPRMLLVFLLRPQQGLPACLVLAPGAERRALQPRTGLQLELLQPRGEFGHGGAGMGAATGTLQHPLQHAVALRLHRLAPGLGHFSAAGVATRKPCGDVLHGAVPVARLFAEAPHGIVRCALRLLGQQLAPPVEQPLPTAGIVTGRCAGRARMAQGIAPGAEVLPGQGFEIAAAGVVGRAGHRRPPLGWLMAWGCAGSC